MRAMYKRVSNTGFLMQATILVVEDHDSMRKALRDWLVLEFPQSRVLEASSGEDAIAFTRERMPSLIVMDFKLPGMNGIETTRRIKEILPSIPVVVLSTREDDIYRTEAIAAGASAYVPKRIMFTTLRPILFELLAINSEQ